MLKKQKKKIKQVEKKSVRRILGRSNKTYK